MNYLHSAKLLYWALPRTGSRYVFRRLADAYDIDDFKHRGPAHAVSWDPEFADYKVICTVRNPYHRVLSAWKWLNMGGRPSGRDLCPDSFGDFVRRITPYGILPITAELGQLVEKVDYVIHLEDCERDLKKIPYFPADLEFPDNPYKSEYRLTPREYYADPCLVDAVWKTYREDFETFGYARGCYVEDIGGR